MKEEFNILFTSAGRRVALVRLFRKALEDLGLTGTLVTTDLRADAPAHFVADVREPAPRVTDLGYVDHLEALCRRHRIRLVVPLIDTELHLLAPHRGRFREFGTILQISSPETTKICFDKRSTNQFFSLNNIQAPAIFDPRAILADPDAGYPYLLKPAAGSASVGVTKVRNARELEFFLGYVPDPIVQEFVVGEEYTLDILVDDRGLARCVVPRLRIETRSGEVSKAMTVRNPDLIDSGKRVAEALPGAFGCITAQCFLTPTGQIKYIEINPRFGGGFPLAAAAGADFPRWIIEMVLGRNPEIAPEPWEDQFVMLRFDDAIFTRKECLHAADFWSSTSTIPSTRNGHSC